MLKIFRLFFLGSSILFTSLIATARPVGHNDRLIPVAVPVNDVNSGIPVVNAVAIDGDVVVDDVQVNEKLSEPSAPPMEKESSYKSERKLNRDEHSALEKRRREEKEERDHKNLAQLDKLVKLTDSTRSFERRFDKMILRFDEALKQDGVSSFGTEFYNMNVGDYTAGVSKAYSFHNQDPLLADVTKNIGIKELEKALSSFKNQFDSFDKILAQYRGKNREDMEAILRSAKEYYIDHKPSLLNLGSVDNSLKSPSDMEQAMSAAKMDTLRYKIEDLKVRLEAINVALGKQYLKSVNDGDLNKVDLHLKLGADLHVRNNSGQNALELAWNDPRMLNFIASVGNKEMVNAKFSDNKLPLDHAIYAKSVDKVSVLMEHGARNVEGFSTESSLHRAVKSGSADIVKVMLDHDVNPNTKYVDTKNMSYLQTMYLHVVSRVMHFFGYSNDGETPLHTVTDQAISKVKKGESADKELAIMKLLKDKGADVDHSKYYGKSVRQEVESFCSGNAHSEFCKEAKSLLNI